MCVDCHFSLPLTETRRSFVRKLAGATVSVGLLGVPRAAAQESPPPVAKSGWARLITPNGDWDFHGDRDGQFASSAGDSIREKTGRFSSTIHHVYAADLRQLCSYPFLFSSDMTAMTNEKEWENIREYLDRGGFIYLDACVHVSPNLKRWEADHLARFTRLLPGAEVRRLAPQHLIFRALSPVDLSQLPGDAFDPPGDAKAFYGIYDDDRMVVVLSLAHLFCGWPQNPSIVDTCMTQIANIYVYSLAH
jgi:Domain of unknown function (DUF4159)